MMKEQNIETIRTAITTVIRGFDATWAAYNGNFEVSASEDDLEEILAELKAELAQRLLRHGYDYECDINDMTLYVEVY